MLFDPLELDQFPPDPGVYLMKDNTGKVIYVGKAKHLKRRLKQYFPSSSDETKRAHDTRLMVPFLTAKVAKIDFLVVSTEKEALLLENTLIKKHKPTYNALLKDDKTFISLMVNIKHPWPMIRLVRAKGPPKSNALYFGPYTNAYAARQTVELLSRIFPLRQCSDQELKRRTRPCLLYSIKRCIAPCVNKCTKEEYAFFVQGAISFLKGNNKEIIQALEASIEQAAEALEFEKAAALLNTLRQIEHVTGVDPTAAQIVSKAHRKNTDALGVYRRGNDVMLAQLFFRDGNLIGSEHYHFKEVGEEDEELLSSFILQHYGSHHLPPEEILLPMTLGQTQALAEILSHLKTEKGHPKTVHLLCPQKGEKKALVALAEKNAKALFEQEKTDVEQREKFLLDLQEMCHLTRYPKQIECFDTSHTSGSDFVACMIGFTDGKKDNTLIRLFRIRDIPKGDDYAGMHQVLTRRLSRAKKEDTLPDLIIVDGGKGQLNVALKVFKELDIASVDVIALTKQEGRHDKGLTQEKIFVPERAEPYHLDKRSPLLFFLQTMRDAVHDKAIRFHKKRRHKRIIK